MNMQRLELDFIAPPRRSRWLGVVLLAGAVIIATLLVQRFHEVQLELESIETRQGLAAERKPARPISRERLDAEAKSVEATLRQLSLPWGTIIEAVEGASSPDVAILQMQPDAQQRLLRIGAEGRTREAMLEYLRRLSTAGSLIEAHVVNHQVQLEDPQRPIQFTVQARLKEAP